MPAGVAVMPLVSLLFHDVYRGEPRESGFDSAAADRYKLSVPEFETQLRRTTISGPWRSSASVNAMDAEARPVDRTSRTSSASVDH